MADGLPSVFRVGMGHIARVRPKKRDEKRNRREFEAHMQREDEGGPGEGSGPQGASVAKSDARKDSQGLARRGALMDYEA